MGCSKPTGPNPVKEAQGRLATYQVNQDSGELTPLETYEGGNGPTWVLITELAG